MDVEAAASRNPKSRLMVLEFVLRRSTLEKIEIAAGGHQFVRIISALCESLTSREELELVCKLVFRTVHSHLSYHHSN